VKYKQPASMGGSITLLDGNSLLHLEDFEQFEVADGRLVVRVTQTTSDRYWKELSVYDKDPTNDPPQGVECRSDDILGRCACSFSGPALKLVVEASFAL